MGKHNPPTRGERRAANARRLREQHRKNKVRKARRKLKNMRSPKHHYVTPDGEIKYRKGEGCGRGGRPKGGGRPPPAPALPEGVLNLNSRQNVDVAPLVAGRVNLKELYLYGCHLAYVPLALAGLVNLTWLQLGGNQIVDVSPLVDLTNLERLHLNKNQIVDVSPLAELVNLTFLKLDQNQIVDVSPLAGLVNLTELRLDGNPIVDTSPLRSLKNTDIQSVVVRDGGDGGCCTIV